MNNVLLMKMKIILAYVIVITTLLFACSTKKAYEKVTDGIIITLPEDNPTQKIRLQLINEKTVRVSATPTDTFPKDNSLIVLPDEKKETSFTIEETDAQITLKTSQLIVSVLLSTGAVSFSDPDGNPLLTEHKEGGKTFELKKVDGESAFGIRQVFHSPEDEAFYGLGGHQNGQMNYKGDDVELVQHNIVDVVPFVYSSKNYGILWDNYSISHFGDPRKYEALSSLRLFDKHGRAGGLTADYYVKDKIVRTAVEDNINYEFLETPEVENFPKDVMQRGKVIWEGSFTSNVEGTHKFLVYASGYFKVWVDDQLIMDKWRQNWNPWTNKFNVDIRKGEKHHLKIEWICEGGYMAVKHLDPLPGTEQSDLSLSSEIADQIDYYFIKGGSADDVISGYRTLTGKAPIAPVWAMGFWQSRERYRNQEELINVVREYRKRRIPLDNIVLDWQYWKEPEWGSHEFDSARFPDPAEMVSTLHDELHASIMISVWPKFSKGTRHYEEMNKNNFLFTRNIEKQRKDWVGPGYESTFYDPFNPAAGKLFWRQIDHKLNRIGFDAWWLDATEPDIHSNLSIEERKLNMSPTALGPGAKYFNAYSLVNSKSVYEGQRRSSPDKRVFILTRSAYAGQQRYGAATWSGDIVSRWSDLKDQIASGVNFSLSGIPYWTMDIGGFAVESRYYDAKGEALNEWRELNTRWFQFGAFCPIFRSHGQYPYREIYNIAPEGHEVYNTMVFYDKLRYRLLPYIYSLAGHTFLNDYTIMRGLIMDFPDDENVRYIGDQYMFGPSLLINPVVEYKARSREVYLPSGTGWYDLYAGKYSEGGVTVKADAPLSRMPVFVKEGSIIPAGPELQYTGEKTMEEITLFVYTGRDARFELYEDEGVNYNYEKGNFTLIPMQYEETSHTLTIGERKGEYTGMLHNRTFRIVWISKDKPAGMNFTAPPVNTVTYDGKPVTIKIQ